MSGTNDEQPLPDVYCPGGNNVWWDQSVPHDPQLICPLRDTCWRFKAPCHDRQWELYWSMPYRNGGCEFYIKDVTTKESRYGKGRDRGYSQDADG